MVPPSVAEYIHYSLPCRPLLVTDYRRQLSPVTATYGANISQSPAAFYSPVNTDRVSTVLTPLRLPMAQTPSPSDLYRPLLPVPLTVACRPRCFNLVNTSHSFDYEDGSSVKKMEELKQEVSGILGSLDDPLECLNMIDTLQRLGIDYHFEEQIDAILSYQNSNDSGDLDDLYNTSLRFRLLRKHGYYVSPNLFNTFKNKEEGFKQELKEDIRGLMSLYEASYLSVEGEDILDEAQEFAIFHLEASLASVEPGLAKQIEHTLKHPLHKSLQRFEARHHIETSYKRHEKFRALIDLAVLDFNFLQSMHQIELKEILRWWKELGLRKELEFTRIQPLKWFMWPLAVIPEPQYSDLRLDITKVIAFVYIIDDIYDVYGSLDELVLFTEIVNRFELEGIERLPRYMEKCFLALYNITNYIGYMIMKKQGWNTIEKLKNAWKILCEAFLIEARWFRSKSMPKADEYLMNAITSSGVHIVLVHVFFLMGQGMTKKTVDQINANTGLISFPAMILRLWDDFGTSMSTEDTTVHT